MNEEIRKKVETISHGRWDYIELIDEIIVNDLKLNPYDNSK